MEDDKLAGFNLVSFGRVYIPLIMQSYKLSDTEAWSEQITVGRAYRRMGLGYELRRRIFIELKKRKMEKLCGGTLRHNTASRGLARRMGFKEITEVRFTRFLNSKKWENSEVTNELFGKS